MARFLFTLWSFPGHLHPHVAVAKELASRGHEAGFYTGPSAQSVVESEHFRFFPYRGIDEAALYRMMFEENPGVRPGRHPFRLQTVFRNWLLDSVPAQVRDVSEILESWKPDIIVSDVTFFGPVLILKERIQTPVTVLSFVPGCMIPGPSIPPWGLGLPLPRGLWGRLRNRCVEFATRGLTLSLRKEANRLRKEFGLAPISVPVNALLGNVPLHIIPSTPEFDYRRTDLPASVRYVGPCVWNKAAHEPAPAWIAELDPRLPVVHATEGTVHGDSPVVLKAAAQGLANLPLHVILTTGKNRDPEKLDLGPLAPNVRIEQWVPHDDLLPRTDVLITTGGGSTTLTALHFGVPMVIVPTQWDKPDNAQRAVEAGVALRLAPRKCTPRNLQAAVQRILSDPSFRLRAREMSRQMDARGGARTAADLLEALLCPSRSTSPPPASAALEPGTRAAAGEQALCGAPASSKRS